ncbi:unnamed protein product [Clonostachys solani]|uniref:RRM domain-containing protein n=1 Tax=Clonostachys solani TaxID=160281 RepID=A0A9N9YUR9_9HYPO|nr:unnamed protein product [Clonostachys solani]
MAQSRDPVFNPQSPRPTAGVSGSFNGTPETRLTAFSPAEGSAKSANLLPGISRASSTTTPVKPLITRYGGSVSHLEKDPFVTQNTKLSPTASTFRPFSSPGFIPSVHIASPVASALSTDLGLSRLLNISSPTVICGAQVEAWLTELDEQEVQFHGQRVVETDGSHIHVRFTDIRDACSVHASSRLGKKEWQLDFLNPTKDTKNDSESLVEFFGQVLIFAVATKDCSSQNPAYTVEAVKKILHTYGQLFAFVNISTFLDGSFRAIAEFCSSTAAIKALATLQKSPAIDGIEIHISPFGSSAIENPTSTSTQELNEARGQPHKLGSAHARGTVAVGAPYQPTIAMYPLMFQSPFTPGVSYVLDRLPASGHSTPLTPVSPSYPVIGSVYQTPPSPALTVQSNQSPSRPMPGYGRLDARRQNAARVNRSPHHNSAGHHNHVDIQRIREGIDVRTTIMLRNIPNKVDQAMLKRIVDESSWGKYDFMYLRIDFANDCNVGYAFINFVDPLDIIDFVDARGNQRWNCFKSDKVAEISYATIQGKDCLVQKFRNSSVMLEAPHYRPKLYFTSNGPMPELAGQEEPFPEPDNQSKMKRSCENAEHVGLFTPNAGQHFRDEQRRRRSQYDRGTRLAALEEYDYETAINHLHGAATH